MNGGGGGRAPELPRTELGRLALNNDLSLLSQMVARTCSATRVAAEREGLATAIDKVDERLEAQTEEFISRLKTRAKAEAALHGMTGDEYETADLITAAAGPVTGSSTAPIIEETDAEQEYFCLAPENYVEGEPSFGSRPTVDLDASDIESPPMTVEDVGKSCYKEIVDWVLCVQNYKGIKPLVRSRVMRTQEG